MLLTLEGAESSDGAKPATDAPAEQLAEPKAPEAPAPAVPTPTCSVQVAVLGGGPGGYTAAFRAADLGLSRRPDRPRRAARRRLPERRLHPVQGAAARRQGA